MSTEFEDIRITGLDAKAMRDSDKGSAMRLMHLTLSKSPPSNWGILFDQERQFPRHSMWRRAWIEGRYIVVDCVPEEIGQHHLADLKQDVANTNQQYRAWLAQSAAASDRKQQEEKAERERIAALGSKLNFD
ncbi:MAG: hypothetical protein WCI81_06545 [Chlorobiaceae bacterium]